MTSINYNKSKTYYAYVHKHGWADIVCAHMTSNRKPYRYWQIKENCWKEALNYETIGDFAGGKYHMAYESARIHGWIDEICSHMKKLGNRCHKCVYAYEFSDNSVYVGITYNIEERNNSHLNLISKKISSVGNYIIKTNLTPILKKLTDYIFVDDAVILEKEYVIAYKNNGWKILNQMKTGGVGIGSIIWNFEKCRIEALKYMSRNDFRIKSNGAYDAAHKNGWLNEICEHMLIKRKYRNYWNFENCKIEALKYNKNIDFIKGSSGAYDAAYNNGWLKEITKHMIK